MQKNFLEYAKHADVKCFDCDASLGTEKPIFYGFPRGAYGLYCADCRMRTYYDTEDKSLSFNKMGDVVAPTCGCGCTTPREQWDCSSGWPRCPVCEYV